MPDAIRPVNACPDCESVVDRRTFLRAVGSVAIVGAAAPGIIPRVCEAAPTAESAAESAAGRFYTSLTDAQKKVLCFPFDHDLRQKISANWHITKPLLGDDTFYSKEQQALVDEIMKNATSPEGYERLKTQLEDDSGGIGDYSVAVFGTPGSKFQWEITGRHLTMRVDGNSVDKAAFGGPIIYGHGAEKTADNVFHYQTKQVNQVFKALDARQAEKALQPKAPSEAAVLIQGDAGKFPGIAVGELSADQKTLVEATLKVLLAPYRKEDVDEVFEILKASGGVDKLHMAFYQQGDLNGDKEWDLWRVEGPSFVWHFRGAPHVHAYINVGQKA